jgi:hypothetical protein
MSTHGRNRAAARGLLATPLALAVAGVVVLAVPAARADGDFGPDTCLNGFVWREAVTNDHVCVTPDIRTQTRSDNAVAASRRSPNGGPFGPDTCVQGFVWREAVSGDHVCVLPATRDQASKDNAAAASRRDEIRTTVYPSGSPQRWAVRTDRINTGKARIYLYRSTTRTSIRSWTVTVPASTSAPGGAFAYRMPVSRCSGSANAYFRVQDLASGRWSLRFLVCANVV